MRGIGLRENCARCHGLVRRAGVQPRCVLRGAGMRSSLCGATARGMRAMCIKPAPRPWRRESLTGSPQAASALANSILPLGQKGNVTRPPPRPAAAQGADAREQGRFNARRPPSRGQGLRRVRQSPNNSPISASSGCDGDGPQFSARHRGHGRGGGTRTPDPRFWRPMLYQLSYTPNPGSPVKAVPHRNQEKDVGIIYDSAIRPPSH